MRHLFISTALALCAAPVLADQIETTAPVREVTLYPYGASVTRIAEVTAPAGTHELVIPGMPDNTDPASLRISAEGATIGAVSLQHGRAVPGEAVKSQALVAAEAEVQRLERALNERDARVATIRARSAAAEDTIEFLKELAGADTAQPVDIKQITTDVSQQMLRAHEAAISAETEARAMEQGREDDEAALERAREKVEAVRETDAGRNALVIAVQTGAEPAKISITGFANDASWQPVYDLRLDRAAKTLTLDRGLLVAQQTGEDWRDVKLTLSTARPSEQSAPTVLQPWFPRILTEAEDNARGVKVSGNAKMGIVYEAAPSPIFAGGAVAGRMMGATVVYDYAAPVTIRTGVDALRLKMDSKELQPEIRATAIPERDSSAFLVAETTNTSGEVILPGDATLFADGVMVGRRQLDLTPAGKEFRLGFGPIDGLVAEFEVPEQSEGGSGILSRSNTSTKGVLLRVRNMTGEEWLLRVVSQVPVSTQSDLKVSWSADPRPSGQDPEGQRGLIYWDGDIAADETQEITVSVDMSWPEGMILQGSEAPGAIAPNPPGFFR